MIRAAAGFIIAIVFFHMTGCIKDPSHSIRIRNSYSAAIKNVYIRNISYGRIEPGATTEYKYIRDGDFDVSGDLDGGGYIKGNGSVTGAGTHKWTLLITSSGGMSISEDK